MYIGIDANEANVKDRVGVNQYAFEILWGLYRLNKKLKSKVYYQLYLRSDPIEELPREDPYWKYIIIRGGKLWVLSRLAPRIAFNNKLDVFFSPHHYLPPISIAPKVCAIHDLGYLKFSDQFKKYDFWQLKYWSAISIYVSKCIITFSNSSKDDIVRHYKISPDKIDVIYHGYDKRMYNRKIDRHVVRHIREKYNLPDDYILFLGTLKPSKNVIGLLKAFAKVREKFPNYRLVISGRKGWLFDDIFSVLKELDLNGHVVFTDFVEEADKPALIAGSRVFVIPSFWEGFGMDIVTSFACGVPVVGSNAGSIPEVGGDAVLLCDPYSIDDIADKIQYVLKMNSKEYNILSQKCIKRAKEFSWEKSALMTLKTLRKASK
jgi:glycosyltransferase involved in cell wall biosynthesis